MKSRGMWHLLLNFDFLFVFNELLFDLRVQNIWLSWHRIIIILNACDWYVCRLLLTVELLLLQRYYFTFFCCSINFFDIYDWTFRFTTSNCLSWLSATVKFLCWVNRLFDYGANLFAILIFCCELWWLFISQIIRIALLLWLAEVWRSNLNCVTFWIVCKETHLI